MGRLDRSIYVRDLEAEVTELIEHATYDYADGSSLISGGGRYVLHDIFNNSNPTNRFNTLVIDRQTGATNRIEMVILSSASDDSILLGWHGHRSQFPSEQRPVWTYRPASHESTLVTTNGAYPVLSGDGSVIVYSQELTNGWQSFVYETGTGRTTPILVEGKGFRFEQEPAVSFNGRFIAFSIQEEEAVDPRTRNLYVYDRILTNFTTVANADGNPVEQVQRLAISADGRTVVFDSSNDQLILRDRNFAVDTFLVRLEIVDTDADFLEDGWEIAHFGSLQQTAAGDSDGDGRSNADELRAGTDPLDAASQFRVLASAGEANTLRLEWLSAPGKIYQVQQSSDLRTWTDLGEPVTAISRQAHLLVPAADPVFYRASIIP